MYDLGSLDNPGRIEIAWHVALAREGGAARAAPTSDPPHRYDGLDPDQLIGRVIFDVGKLDEAALHALSWHVAAAVAERAHPKKALD